MISNAKIKWINSLKLKKNRDEAAVFVAEGVKIVTELLAFLPCRYLVYTTGLHPGNIAEKSDETAEISEKEYQKISSQKSPQGVLAVFEQSKYAVDESLLNGQLSLVLDSIQDPGNLGTILRTADWFGVKDIFCSIETADIYNPKVVQASMGAIARVRVHYLDLVSFFEKLPPEIPVYGTWMTGENVYETKLNNNAILLMGNEGKGVSADLLPFISHKLHVPRYPTGSSNSESLNVSVATAVCLAEFRRQA